MGKHIREDFTDSTGEWVSVGDRVKATYPNKGLGGTVIAQNTDPTVKAFTVKADNGDILYFNREWTFKTRNRNCFRVTEPRMLSQGWTCGNCDAILDLNPSTVCDVCGWVNE